jgi:exosortase A
MQALTGNAVETTSWRATLLAAGILFFAVVGLFRSTASSMVATWHNTETYTHGFLILPIFAWLVWHKRHHLAAFQPQPAPGLLLLVAAALVAWLLARLAGVLVVEQLALVGVLVAGWASLVGWQVTRFLSFPLLFLFFAVPMGEDLVPPMMEYTATFTVKAVELSGIPVYRDGMWFSLPSGNWSVVEACSGVRYLIASVTLGVVYAYITYHTLWKRLTFIAMSIIVPIIANGVRAYIIVMIGHLSSMEYATGVDHLIYGWIFFGFVMFLLFWIGAIWRETEPPPTPVAPPRSRDKADVKRGLVLCTALTVAGATLAAGAAQRAAGTMPAVNDELSIVLHDVAWRTVDEPPHWTMRHQPDGISLQSRMTDGKREVQLFAVLFPHQRQGAEAIHPGNRLAERVLRRTPIERRDLRVGTEVFPAMAERVLIDVDGRRTEHLVLRWYRVAGKSLLNPYVGKAYEAIARLYPGRADGMWLAVTTRYDPLTVDGDLATLDDFATDVVPALYVAADRLLGIGERRRQP